MKSAGEFLPQIRRLLNPNDAFCPRNLYLPGRIGRIIRMFESSTGRARARVLQNLQKKVNQIKLRSDLFIIEKW